jgi:hypothetical protein
MLLSQRLNASLPKPMQEHADAGERSETNPPAVRMQGLPRVVTSLF